MKKYVFINGKYILKDEAAIALFDSGFLFGDGLFETIRSYNGKIFLYDSHINRLFKSLSILRYKLPLNDAYKTYIKISLDKLIIKNKLTKVDTNIKIIISRGKYEKRLDLDSAHQPNLIITAEEVAPYPDVFYLKGVDIITSPIRRVPYQNFLYRHKLLNYFENIYSRNESNALNAQDSIFLTSNDYILEGSTTNFFMVKNEIVATPTLDLNILPGITRETVIKLCKANKIKIKETKIKYKDAINADEIFITNTLAEILPVKKFDNFEIINEIPGRITKMLISFYKQKTISK